MSIRIVIADDHPMIVDGLQSILVLHPHIKLIGSYLNGEDLLKGLEKEVPDLLLLDIQLPDRSGDELAPIILKKYPEIRILTLTNFDNGLYAHKMFQNGVHGYLLKTANKDVLIQAIETVYNGGQFVEEKTKHKMQELNIHQTSISKARLTQREKDVLQLIVNGVETNEIADTLFLGINTIKTYRRNLLLKLQVNNIAALAKKAVQMGLVK